MTSRAWTEAPRVECPNCNHSWHMRDAFEIRLDHEDECPNCGAAIVLEDEEVIRSWTWKPRADHLKAGAAQAVNVETAAPTDHPGARHPEGT